jgi:hypothetical protein
MQTSDTTSIIIAGGVVSTAVQAIILLLIRYEIMKAIDSIKDWVEQFFVRSNTVDARLEAIKDRLDRLPCERCNPVAE